MEMKGLEFGLVWRDWRAQGMAAHDWAVSARRGGRLRLAVEEAKSTLCGVTASSKSGLRRPGKRQMDEQLPPSCSVARSYQQAVHGDRGQQQEAATSNQQRQAEA